MNSNLGVPLGSAGSRGGVERETPGMILYLAADLIWATRIKSTADGLGISARPVRSIEMLGARLGDSDVTGFIVDLETEAALVLIAELRRAESDHNTNKTRIKIIAFGPHVDVERLEGARAAGADRVMTRGAFAGRLSDVIREIGGGAGP
ncbi:MAG: hypothetical protein KF745_04095 [Phycisphaeraceae bacterium]|nr:hypothetical protein [Phycisphaeraceae bacterium]